MFGFLFGSRPKPALKRIEPRRTWSPALNGARMFDASRSSRLTGDWISTPVTAELLIRQHQRVLVARAREQVVNNDYARAFVRICRQNIVGPKGVMLQAAARRADGSLDTDLNQAIEAAWLAWGSRDTCDIAGKQSWRAIQATAVASCVKDGEFMLRKIYGQDAGPFGFALQILDPQRCNPQFDVYNLPGGRFIRSGIEFNPYGRPVAYHFSVVKESDEFYNYTYAGLNYHRIPAEEIIHGFVPDMVGQRRGLPWMATGLFRLKQLAGLENAAIVNARVGASKMGVIQWRDGTGPDMPDDETASFHMEAEPGEFQVLPEGAELKEWNPQYPTGEFAPFSKAILRGISAGFGVLYNNLAHDLEGVNFSSIRQGTLDEREYWKECQEWLIEELIQPVYEAWLPRALLAGLVRIGTRPVSPLMLDACRTVFWQPRRWAWIDPTADIDASIAAKNNLLMSPGQIIREQGKEPLGVWREIAADIKEMKQAGIPDDFINAAVLNKNFGQAAKGPNPGVNI